MSKKRQTVKPDLTLFQRLDHFFEKRLSLFFYLSIVLTVVFGFYLFNLRISEGGDDSGYIENAKRFMDGIAYPGFHGAFYSIFLSWVLKIFGFKIFVLKFTSFLFLTGHMVFFYYTFRGRIPATVLVMAMLLSSVSVELLYFGSQTYTEAMYLFLQSILFFLVIRYVEEIGNHIKLIYQYWWVVLLMGLIVFLMSITRNVGIAVLGVLLFFLLTERKFYLAGYTLLSFILFRIPFTIYKSLRWNLHGEDLSTQLNGLLLKNYYNAALGREDFGGMVKRFFDNSEIYLSRLLMIGTGIKDPGYSETSLIVTILVYLLFGAALFYAIKKSQVMRFVGYYLGIILFVTFVILQQHWGQMRLVIIYMPLIYLFLPWGMLELGQIKKIRWLQPVIVLLLFLMFFNLFGQTINRAKANNEVLMKNLRGNKYYGYTPDWVNFLKMSEWAAENIPDGSVIASRKPSMSFIYGEGRNFYGLYRIPTLPADTAIIRMAQNPGEPVILSEKELKSSGMPMQLEYGMKRQVEAFISIGDTVYSVYYFSDRTRPAYLELIRQYGLSYGSDLDYLNGKMERSGKPGIVVVPDSLINPLLRNNVDYIIRGSLRLNPAQKTNRVINTVHRYMYYMEQKYPGIFSQVSQIGGVNDEPAYLFMIHWERFGLDKGKPGRQNH